jgi:hypothetical protein
MRMGLGVLACATIAAGAVLWLPDLLMRDQLAVVTEVGEGGLARVAVPAESTPGKPDGPADPARFFGFALPQIGLAAEKSHPTESRVAVTSPPPDAAVTTIAPEPKLVVRASPAPLHGSPVTVVSPAVAPITSVALPRERPRHELARDIQRELKRVGCYAGEVDGNWGPGSKRAAQNFMQRVNSSLPTDEPDLVQLTLLRSFSGITCAAPCPPEQLVPGSARCLPAPVLAARPQARPIEGSAIAASSATGSARPAYAGASPVLRTGPTGDPGMAPAVAANAAPRTTAESPVTVMPLEGRMAVGAPPPTTAQILAAPPVSGVTIAPPRRADREVRRVRPASRVRRDRNWTATFFDR